MCLRQSRLRPVPLILPPIVDVAGLSCDPDSLCGDLENPSFIFHIFLPNFSVIMVHKVLFWGGFGMSMHLRGIEVPAPSRLSHIERP